MKENNFEKKETIVSRIDFLLDRENEVDVFMHFWKEYGSAVHDDLKYLEQEDDEDKVRQTVEKFVADRYDSHEAGYGAGA